MIEPANSIYVVVPTFNEGSVIRSTVIELLSHGFKVIVVNDGSTDNVRDVLEDLVIDYVEHVMNLGQGAALQTGIDLALYRGASMIATFDADGQHSATDITRMHQHLIKNKLDFVFGSRFLEGAKTNAPIVRKILLNISRYLNFIISGVLLTDCNNGLRLFTAQAAMRFRIRENRRTHSADIIYQVVKSGLRYDQIPVTIHYSAYSLQKGIKNTDSVKILLDLILYKIFR